METANSIHTETRWAGLREVLVMAWPIILAMMSMTIMHFVDTLMVSQLSAEALAAVPTAGFWSFLALTFFMGVVGCVSTFVSQSLGRGERRKCASYAWQGIYLSIITGVAAMVLLWPMAERLFDTMPHSPEVRRLETEYFRIRLLAFAFVIWQAALTSFFQAIRRTAIPMVVGIIANVINAVLDYGLIFGALGFPRLEVAGAAIATVVAIIAQALILQAIFLSPQLHAAYATRSAFRFDTHKLRELVRIGWPAGFTFFMDLLTWGIFGSYIVGHFGVEPLAAHNATMTIIHVSFMPAVGLNHAIAPIVGEYIGRGDIARAKARAYTATKVAALYMFLAGAGFALFGRSLMEVFADTPGVAGLGYKLLLIAAAFQAFDAVNIVMLGALRGAGDTRWQAIVMVLLAYFFFLPAASMLSFATGARVMLGGWAEITWPIGAGLEAAGAWLGATAYIIVLSGVLLLRFHGERWRNINIFIETPQESV